MNQEPEKPQPVAGMKAKNIKSVVRRKVEDWLASIKDDALRELVSKNVIVTGGAIASMLVGETVNDFDVYFRDHATTLAVARHYLKLFKSKRKSGIEAPLSIEDEGGRIRIVVKSSGIVSEEGAAAPYEYFGPDERAENYVGEVINDPARIEDAYQETEAAAQKAEGAEKYRPVFITSNAITLSHRVQLMLRFYGEPDTIHENYDYVHCTCYWKSWDGELVLRPAALESLLARELRYVGSKYPICSAVRLRKFLARGWRVNAGQILKIAMQISGLDLKDLKVLEDQLMGVDTAYFLQLIERLKERDPEKVDAAYLVEIVDKLF